MRSFDSFHALSFDVEIERDLSLEFKKKLLSTKNKELTCITERRNVYQFISTGAPNENIVQSH